MFQHFSKLASHPIRFRLFLLAKLPMAFFAGLRIKKFSENICTVAIKYRWMNTNPFRSTYFACLAMAAEMSTGALAMGHLYKNKPAVSMLILGNTGEYFKKATRLTSFTCHEGLKLKAAIAATIASGEAEVVTVESVGVDEHGNEVARFSFTWSFRVKV